MAEQKETIILDFQIEQGEAISELEKTKISIIQLKEEQKKLTEAYKKNTITLEEYASESVRVEGVLKKQTNSYNTLQKAATGVKTQFDKLVEANQGINKSMQNVASALSDISSNLASVVPGLGGFKKAQEGVNLALKANPIGAVVTLLFALKEILGGNAVIADNLSFAFTALNKAFSFITDTIVATVTNFDKLKEAITSPLQFIKDLASGTVDAAKAGFEAAKAQDEFTVKVAKANAVIKENEVRQAALEKQLKDRTKSEQERIKIAEQLADLEIANVKQRKALADEELRIEKALLDGKTLSGEEEAKLIELNTAAKVAAAEEEVAIAQKQTRINILLAKEETAAKKEASDEQKRYIKEVQKAEDEALLAKEKNHQREMEMMIQELLGYEARQKAAQDLVDSIEIVGEAEAEVADQLDEATLKSIDNGRKRVAADKERSKQIQELNNLEKESTKIFAESTFAGKAISATLATTNTYLGATEALKQKSTLPSPFDVIAKIANVAAIITTGLSAVKNITAAAGGGDFITKGPQLLLVGDNPGGRERVTVEPLSGRGQTVVGSNMIKLAGGGVVETQSATASARANFAFASIDKRPIVYTSITELREAQSKVEFKEQLVTV